MRSPDAVRRQLRSIDGRDHGAYQSLHGPIGVGDPVAHLAAALNRVRELRVV